MQAVAGSHVSGIAPHGKSDRDGNLLSINQEIPGEHIDKSKVQHLELEAGQISIHHGKVYHCSTPNISDRRRCGLTVRFIRPEVDSLMKPNGSTPADPPARSRLVQPLSGNAAAFHSRRLKRATYRGQVRPHDRPQRHGRHWPRARVLQPGSGHDDFHHRGVCRRRCSRRRVHKSRRPRLARFCRRRPACHRQRAHVILGVGSIVDAPTAGLYISSGANFVVGPLLNPEVARLCNAARFPIRPVAAASARSVRPKSLVSKSSRYFPGARWAVPIS